MNSQIVSVDPVSGRSYSIPEVLNDQEGIDQFLSLHPDKKVVVIQGLGFVGAVMSIVCANALNEEYAVIGVDLANEANYWKIKTINDGSFPIVASDPKINEFFNAAREKRNFYATFDEYAYSKADVIIVDINLDVHKQTGFLGELKEFNVDLTPFKKAITSIGRNCRSDALILIETTVPPGTTQKVAYPILKECLEQRKENSSSLKLGHSYERVMPGPDYIDSIQNFYRVYSGIDEASANATEAFLRTIISTKEYPLTRLGNTNATEMAKVLENSFRAMNIAFTAEWSRYAEEAGVNLYEVVQAIRMRPTHKNLMLPGIGVGGYCLTKDPLLASWSKMNLFQSKEGLGQSVEGVRINDQMPLFAYRYMKRQFEMNDLSGCTAVLMGVSYRSNVGDTRYSPVEPFYNYLVHDKCEVRLHDPYVRYWEEKKLKIEQDFEKVLEGNLDLVIFSTGHSEYRNSDALIQILHSKSKMLILDAVGILSESEIQILSSKHTVRVLGRGDLS